MLICQDGEVDISKLSNEKMWYVAAVKQYAKFDEGNTDIIACERVTADQFGAAGYRGYGGRHEGCGDGAD